MTAEQLLDLLKENGLDETIETAEGIIEQSPEIKKLDKTQLGITVDREYVNIFQKEKKILN